METTLDTKDIGKKCSLRGQAGVGPGAGGQQPALAPCSTPAVMLATRQGCVVTASTPQLQEMQNLCLLKHTQAGKVTEWWLDVLLMCIVGCWVFCGFWSLRRQEQLLAVVKLFIEWVHQSWMQRGWNIKVKKLSGTESQAAASFHTFLLHPLFSFSFFFYISCSNTEDFIHKSSSQLKIRFYNIFLTLTRTQL